MRIAGRWRITEAELWDCDALNLVAPTVIEFAQDGSEDDVAERLEAAGQLHDQAVTALDSALADTEARVRLCEAAIEVLEPLGAQLRHALARIRAVPSDLGETYESVSALIRHGGAMPHQGRWITGQETVTA